MKPSMRLILWLFAVCVCASTVSAADFLTDVHPLLIKYCGECHSGDEANGDIDFTVIQSKQQVQDAYELWESVAGHLQNGTMPPQDEPKPDNDERGVMLDWYQQFVDAIESRPAVFAPRRLSVSEYRNTLESLLGFELLNDVIEAEQTVTERSLVVKLLPIDPPGESGFKNDTHNNPLTTVTWDQMIYLVDSALVELLSPARRPQLEAFAGKIDGDLTQEHVRPLLIEFTTRAYRRPLPQQQLDKIVGRLANLEGESLNEMLMTEMKAVLMSPRFFYRGLMATGTPGKRQPVDAFELAERMSYFLWSDMPDKRLYELAASGKLLDDKTLATEVERMLRSSKSRRLTEVFAYEWLTLSEIKLVSNEPTQVLSLLSQPLDFMHYLFTENRPVIEIVDSRSAFVNPLISRMYGKDAKQLPRYRKQRGIEREVVENQRIELRETTERGGLLTMPAILAMNRGPILRGTWVLERILGEHLSDPPANVGQVQPNRGGQKLTFRQRFEQHRANESCAVCHDKIDPLGFALQAFDKGGGFIKDANYRPPKSKGKDAQTPNDKAIDTSGKLPSGETFQDAAELKAILVTSQREMVVRNAVERTLSFALCRRLQVFDKPAVDAITQEMMNDGTWRDLFVAIVKSVPFREAVFSSGGESSQ